jgi:hypothetical protein
MPLYALIWLLIDVIIDAEAKDGASLSWEDIYWRWWYYMPYFPSADMLIDF